uniref:DUF4408 domain-containing protein n=1 Tax=Setaria digitata TaxID=48799 RepID=A0A915PJZ1_9BILA
MTTAIIISLIPVALNISYIMTMLVICIRKRKIEKAKDKGQQDKPTNLAATSTPANQEEKPIGDTAKHDDKKVIIVNQEAVATTPGTPQQLSQLKSTATQQTQNRISDEHGKLKRPNDKQVKKMEEGQKKDAPQKSVKRRKKETKKGAKSETAKTQKSEGVKEKSKEGEIIKVEEDDEEEDDTMKGIASLRQDLNIVSIEE